jgi:predicted GNAT family acetyltransferase
VADVEVTNNETEKRYEARLGDELAGSAYYDLADDLIVFTHTEVDDAYEGHGVGSALGRAALDDVRADGRRMVVARGRLNTGGIDRHLHSRHLLEAPPDAVSALRPGSNADSAGESSTGLCTRRPSAVHRMGSCACPIHRFALRLGVSPVPLVAVRSRI